MRQNILLFGFVAYLLLLPTSTQALNTSRSAPSQIEQSNITGDRSDGSGTVAFFADVGRTIWEIPEPATLLLLGAGLAAASRFMQRRRRSL